MHRLANRRQLELVIGTILMFWLLYSTSPVQADNRPVLRINDTNEPPLTTPQQDGFLDIVASEAFGRVGVKLVLIKLPAERALINANAGIEDGDLTRIVGLEKTYPNLIRVPEKLIDWNFVAYSKNRDIVARWPSLRQHAVGHVTGWKIYEQQLQGAPQVISTRSPTELFYLLQRDRIEVALYAQWMGQSLIQQLGLQNIHQLEPALDTREMFIYLHKQHAELVPRLALALRELKQEGFYDRIRKQKLNPFNKTSTP